MSQQLIHQKHFSVGLTCLTIAMILFFTSAHPVLGNPSPNGTDTILLFDTSGSMGDQDSSGGIKLEAAQAAGNSILNIIEAENQIIENPIHQVGIVDFHTFATVDLQATGNIDQVRSVISQFRPGEGTAMADGLRAALDVLQNRAANTKPMIILLSDGAPNVGLNGDQTLDESAVFNQVLDLSTEAGNQEICIYTVGFGVPGDSSSFNEELLRQVAANSRCGEYFVADNATELTNIYIELRHASTGNIIMKKTGQISQGENVDLESVDVPENQEMLVFTVNWPGSKIDPIVKDPAGRIVDTNYPGVSFYISKSMVNIIIQAPVPGTWRPAIIGVDVPEGIMPYHAILSARVSSVFHQSGTVGVVLTVLIGGSTVIFLVSYYTFRSTRKRSMSGASATLSCISGTQNGQLFTVDESTLVGRGSRCDLFLPKDTTVSRFHARIRFSSGEWFIQDQGSQHGTFVNGEKIKALRLHNGDRIKIGDSTFIFNR